MKLHCSRFPPVRRAVILALLVSLFALSLTPDVDGSGGARLQPILQELAAAQPDAPVAVIVQKSVSDDRLERLTERLGGAVTKELWIIRAFAAEMPASAVVELSQAEGVRWISLDAITSASAETQFVSWATAFGPEVLGTLQNGAFAVDSVLGPNGTYALGVNGNKASFTNFSSEATPGYAVSKVEVLLRGYAPYVHHDFRIKVYVAGSKLRDYTVKWEAWSPFRSPDTAASIAVDITNARAWKWQDLDNQLEIYLDLGPFDDKDSLALDAVGLRVTSTPGYDFIGDSGGDDSPLAAIDGGQQLNVYNGVIRAPQAWNSPAHLQGKGVTVAVVDSGVFKTKDLEKRIRANIKFNRAFHDAADRYGHGTFVAGVIGGSGAQSARKYMGVAPRADLLNVRVSDDNGMALESDVVSAMQWVLENKSKYNIRVLNLSLNSAVAQSYHTSPLAAASEILWFNGIAVVAAAGNNGTASLYPPANDPFVITVGATDDRGTPVISDDAVATFSAYGTTENGVAKPDLVAPGKNIIGLLPENDKLSIGRTHPANQVNKTYFRMSGTSVSAPMVSGAIALLLQDEPALTPDQVKYRLMATANKNWAGYDAARAGAGYLDVYAAIVGTTTQSANTGFAVSNLLTSGPDGVLGPSVSWNSVSWNSVSWNSVSWNSVSWNSVSWNSVSWNSDYWDP